MSQSTVRPAVFKRDSEKALILAWRFLSLVVATLVVLWLQDLAVGGIIAVMGDHSAEWIDFASEWFGK